MCSFALSSKSNAPFQLNSDARFFNKDWCSASSWRQYLGIDCNYTIQHFMIDGTFSIYPTKYRLFISLDIILVWVQAQVVIFRHLQFLHTNPPQYRDGVFLLLDWLPPKTRESCLSRCLTHCWKNIHSWHFQRYFYKVNERDSIRIGTERTDSIFHTDNCFAICIIKLVLRYRC